MPMQLTPARAKDRERIVEGGEWAAMDSSGGSVGGVMEAFGLDPKKWEGRGNEIKFRIAHEHMRARIMADPEFTGEKISAAILFADTVRRDVGEVSTVEHLRSRGIAALLKIDEGLAEMEDGVQLMKPITQMQDRLDEIAEHEIFGTKERSVIHEANETGIKRVVQQQLEVGRTINQAGAIPTWEPEVSIKSESKAEAEEILLRELLAALDTLGEDEEVMIKLTLPETPNLYRPVIEHPRVLSVVALSGGYDQETAVSRLAENNDMRASFSRAFFEGLHADMNPEEFSAAIKANVDRIYEASMT